MIPLLIVSAINIAVSIFPLKGIVEEIGSHYFSYEVIYPYGANPHMYEPRPTDILKVKKSDLFIYSGRAEPGGEKLCKMAKRCVSLEKIIKVGRKVDPHVWLTPWFVKNVADSLADILAGFYPQLKDTFKQNASRLKSFVDSTLKYAKVLDKSVVLMHGAFKPLFENLGFNVFVISKEPGIEPGARRIKELSDELQGKTVCLGVCEKGRPCDALRILARRFGFNIIILDPLYNHNFTSFLKDAVSKIKNATNSCN